jgi:murein DD-endopeptidase
MMTDSTARPPEPTPALRLLPPAPAPPPLALLALLPLLLGAAAPDAGAPASDGRRTCGEWRLVEVPLTSSIAVALGTAVPDDGNQLAAHYARIFMWDLDLRRDLVPGDRISVTWRRAPGGDLEIGAASYHSQRLQRTLRAHRFQPAADMYASYWDETGQEVPRRLKASPLLQYEQITALLKDRPTHRGMDFKTPTGTEVQAPRAGTVSRRDWKLRGNGRCLEIRFDDGVVAKFLHLSVLKVAAGARVRAGQVVALTGNTGRSTAPHLHYQLERGRRTVDPIDYHGWERRRLAGQALTDFKAHVARLGAICTGSAP